MSKMILRRRGDWRIQSSGIWAGTIFFECPWAHPLWSTYMILIYDLTTTTNNKKTPHKKDPSATHEMGLYPLDPKSKVDYGKSCFDQVRADIMPLTPANCGYQFVSESNEKAWDRINGLVDRCFKEVVKGSGVFELNPDTDYRRQWDIAFEDGWSLLVR